SRLPDSYKEGFFKVSGMHCSTCESFIETLAERNEGIYKCEASYSSELMKVYYDSERINSSEIPSCLSRMGYVIHDVDSETREEDLNEVARLVIGGFFGIIGLLLYSLFLYPAYFTGEGFIPLSDSEIYFFISNILVMTSFVLFYTGFPILRGAWVSLSVLKPNMDLLISIAALSAYLYSFGALISGSDEVYFDITMAIILVVSIGNYYEKSIKSGKQNILDSLRQRNMQQARILANGEQKMVEISEVHPGDKILIKAGERIPVDGEIIKGGGVINEALMTGESFPVRKKVGDHVLSGTVLTQNALTLKAGNPVQSTVDEILRLMWNIQSSRPGHQRLADRIAAYFVPLVLFLGIAAFAYHLLIGESAITAMLSALTVLIVSCPCALGLATPLAISSGTREALANNIIIKTAAVFEENANIDILALDKTGTLTTGEMQLLEPGENKEALYYAAKLEQYSLHPVAGAIVSYSSNGVPEEVEDFQSYQKGVSGIVEGKKVWVGQPEWLGSQGLEMPKKYKSIVSKRREEGSIPVAVGWDETVQSILVVGDRLREDAMQILEEIKRKGKKIAVITGDSERASQVIYNQISPDFLFTDARPDSKSNIIRELRSLGRVGMVGDGSNDAPALAEADLGIAFGDLTALAADSSQIVIPNDKLSLIPAAFTAIKLTKNRIRQNLAWAFLYNIITIPLALAGMINPLFAAGAMAASSLLVVGNSSRKMKL
ncbi:MAG: heavy metal translocating P-type ATPase, partial [Candidatus Halalkalibacterium sp. M3_1C_030]